MSAEYGNNIHATVIRIRAYPHLPILPTTTGRILFGPKTMVATSKPSSMIIASSRLTQDFRMKQVGNNNTHTCENRARDFNRVRQTEKHEWVAGLNFELCSVIYGVVLCAAIVPENLA